MTPAVSEEMVDRAEAAWDQEVKRGQHFKTRLRAAIEAALSTLAPSAVPSERLFDQNHPMADGEERMTAAEDALAWLVIEKCGCPDDTPITPKEASDTIAGMIDHLRKYEDAALASPSAAPDEPDWKHAFAVQSRKLQAILHIPGVREALAELEFSSPLASPSAAPQETLVEARALLKELETWHANDAGDRAIRLLRRLVATEDR